MEVGEPQHPIASLLQEVVTSTDFNPYLNPIDYELCTTNKPQINGVELSGNKKDSDLGIKSLTNSQIQSIINRI